MPTTITGNDGVSQVQDGVVTVNDLVTDLDLSGKNVTLPAGVGGKVLQAVQISSANLTDIGVTQQWVTISSTQKTITCTVDGSSFLYTVAIPGEFDETDFDYGWLTIARDGSRLASGLTYMTTGNNDADQMSLSTYTFLDSPNKTAGTTITYAVQNYSNTPDPHWNQPSLGGQPTGVSSDNKSIGYILEIAP